MLASGKQNTGKWIFKIMLSDAFYADIYSRA